MLGAAIALQLYFPLRSKCDACNPCWPHVSASLVTVMLYFSRNPRERQRTAAEGREQDEESESEFDHTGYTTGGTESDDDDD